MAHLALRHRDVLGRSATAQPAARPGREVTELGRRLARLGPVLEGYEPDAEVAILWSTDTRFAFEYQPPLADETGTPDALSYRRIFEASYRGILDAGAQARVLHVGQAVQLGGAELAHSFPVLVAPAVYVATDAQLQLLADYAEAGGHLIVGIRTGYGDEEARARFAIAPDVLNKPAGVWYEEFSNLAAPLELGAAAPLTLTPAAHAAMGRRTSRRRRRRARYRHREFGRFAAITTRQHGDGRITVLGTVPNPALGAELMRWAVPEPIAAGWSIVGSPVRLVRPSGRRRACGSCTTGRAATPR